MTTSEKGIGYRIFFLIAVLSTFSSHGFGQIVWKTTVVEKSADLAAKQIEIDFPFQNNGTVPVTFLLIQPRCPCTTINKMKMTYAPGESGVLSAIFSVDQRTGLQEKYIDYQTDGMKTPLRLTFRVTLPKVATLVPNHLVWKMGGAPTPEKMGLTVEAGSPVNVLRVTSSDKNFNIEVQTIQKGAKYTIVVTPRNLDAPFKSDIVIQTDYPSARPRELKGLAEILPPGK